MRSRTLKRLSGARACPMKFRHTTIPFWNTSLSLQTELSQLFENRLPPGKPCYTGNLIADDPASNESCVCLACEVHSELRGHG
jgi:hypothetical protein